MYTFDNSPRFVNTHFKNWLLKDACHELVLVYRVLKYLPFSPEYDKMNGSLPRDKQI